MGMADYMVEALRCGSALRIIAVRESDGVVGILSLYLRRISVALLLYAHELRLVGTGADTSAEGARVFDMLKGGYAYKSSGSNDVRRTFEPLAYNA